jgi:hypothetical protein
MSSRSEAKPDRNSSYTDSLSRNNSQNDSIVANRYRIEKKLSKSSSGGTYIVSDTKHDDDLYFYLFQDSFFVT